MLEPGQIEPDRLAGRAENRLTTGVQPSRKQPASTVTSSRGAVSSRNRRSTARPAPARVPRPARTGRRTGTSPGTRSIPAADGSRRGHAPAAAAVPRRGSRPTGLTALAGTARAGRRRFRGRRPARSAAGASGARATPAPVPRGPWRNRRRNGGRNSANCRLPRQARRSRSTAATSAASAVASSAIGGSSSAASTSTGHRATGRPVRKRTTVPSPPCANRVVPAGTVRPLRERAWRGSGANWAMAIDGTGCDEAGLHDLEQRSGDLRRLRLVQALQPGGEKGERFDQPLDMRVGRTGGVERQPAGDLRIAAGEGGAGAAQVGQLGQVVRQQLLGRLNPHRRRRRLGRPARTRSSPRRTPPAGSSRPRPAPARRRRGRRRPLDRHRRRAQARLPGLDGARQVAGEPRPGVGVGGRVQRQVGDAIIHDRDRPSLQLAGRGRRARVEQPLELSRDRIRQRGSGRRPQTTAPPAPDGRTEDRPLDQSARRPSPCSGDFLRDQIVRDRLHAFAGAVGLLLRHVAVLHLAVAQG